MFETTISASSMLLVGLLLLTVGCGAPGAEPEHEGTLNILVENDTLAGTDRHNTSGLQFSLGEFVLARNIKWVNSV